MATGGNAIFTEVLEIGIDTTEFAKKMKEVEAIYANSLKNMPDLGSVSTAPMNEEIRKAAEVFTIAAQQIGKATLSINEDIAIMVAQSEANMSAMAATVERSAVAKAAAKAAAELKKAGQAAKETGLDMDRFASGFESAMYRIPGRMAVIALLGATMAALLTPVKLLKDGFEELAAQSPDFKATRTQLEDTFSVLEQIGAKPLFDNVLEAMHQLNTWLNTNRDEIEKVVFAFGKLVAADIQPLIDMLSSHPGTGLLEAINVVLSAIGIFIAAVKVGVLELGDFVKLLSLVESGPQGGQSWKTWATEVKAALKSAKDDAQDYVGELQGIGAASIAASDAANGKGAPAPDGIVAKNQQDTLKTALADYKLQQQQIREIAKTNTDAIALLKEKEVIDQQEADRRKLASAEDTLAKMKTLATQFIAAIPMMADVKRITDVNLRAEIEQIQKGVAGGGGTNNPVTQQENAVQAAKLALFKDGLTEEKSLYQTSAKDIQAHYTEEVEMAKAAAKAKSITNVQELDAEKVAEDSRFAQQKANIAAQRAELAKQGLGTAAGPINDQLNTEDQANINKHAELTAAYDSKHQAARDADVAAERQLTEAAQKTADIREKGAMADAKAVGDKRTEQRLTQEADEQHLANLQRQLQEESSKVFTPGGPGAATQASNEAKLQAEIDVLKSQLARESSGVQSASTVNAQANLQVSAAIASAAEEQAKLTGSKRAELAAAKETLAIRIQEQAILVANAKLELTKAAATGSDTELQSALNALAIANAKLAGLQKQQEHATYSDDAIGKAQYARDNRHGPTAADNMGKALGLNFDNLSKNLDNADSSLEKFAIGITAGVTAIASLATEAGKFYDDLKRGGAGAAIGGALSNSKVQDGLASGVQSAGDAMGIDALSKISDEMPMIGPAIGAVMSVVTNLFAQSIQNMVNDINQQISAINQQAQLKQIGIQQQIAELKAEEQTAINELGGKKKATDQLKTILTSLNTQIAQLQFQAAQTVQQFNDMAAAGGLGNMTGIMASWASTWEQINQQVEQYIQAGGSVTTAAEYMNQQLQAQRQTLQDQLNQGDTTAINDAIQLNQLLTQRVQMMKDEAATEFGMLNSDSVERRTASAVQLGTALTKQRDAYNLQLQQTNSQIALDQSRVAAEGQIFSIATSLAALQAQSNALNIAALNEQLAKYQDMQTLLNATAGMTFTPGSINPGAGLNGTQAGIPGEPTVAGPINFAAGAIVVNGDVTEANATTLGAAIAQNLRSGRTSLNTN